MAINYTSQPTVTKSPSPAPGPGVLPTISQPQGTDPLTVESLYQAQEVPTDFIGHIQSAVRLDAPVVAATGIGFSAPSYASFGGTVTPSGNVHISDGTRFVIKIIVGGAVGTATFQTSIDGGNTFGSTQTTAASMTDATSGIKLAFSGTMTTNGTATFRSAFTPLAQWNDSSANVRSVVDYVGFRTGPAVETYDAFLNAVGTSGVTSAFRIYTPGGWLLYSTTNTAAARGGSKDTNVVGVWPTGAYHLALTSARTNTDYAAIITPFIYSPDTPTAFTKVVHVFDWAFAFTDIAQTDVFCGLVTNNFGAIDPNNTLSNLCGLRWAVDYGGIPGGVDTTLKLMTQGNAFSLGTGVIDTGIAPVAGTIYRCRLEVHRSGTPLGDRAILWVNGTRVEATTNLPIQAGTADMAFQFSVKSGGNPGTKSGIEIGYWKNFLTPVGMVTTPY